MTLIEELEQAAKDYESLCRDGDICEGCSCHDRAARLRARAAHIQAEELIVKRDGPRAQAIFDRLTRELGSLPQASADATKGG